MLGAIAGDVIGSMYEHVTPQDKSFPFFCRFNKFTDETILNIAIADAILNQCDYKTALLKWGRSFNNAGFGARFSEWLGSSNPQPYESYGSASAGRAIPIGWAFDSEEDVLKQAKLSAEPTHNHPDGIRGAQAIALSVFYARKTHDKKIIKEKISTKLGYDLSIQWEDLKKNSSFDVTCNGSVPQALCSFFNSENFEDAIRNAITLGGDSDNLACMTGGIAEAFYGGVPSSIAYEVKTRIPQELKDILDLFSNRFIK